MYEARQKIYTIGSLRKDGGASTERGASGGALTSPFPMCSSTLCFSGFADGEREGFGVCGMPYVHKLRRFGLLVNFVSVT